jgi:hypothetical protein
MKEQIILLLNFLLSDVEKKIKLSFALLTKITLWNYNPKVNTKA